MKMRDSKISKVIKNNVQMLIEKKIIRSEKDLEDPTLDAVAAIGSELNICVKDIICCYCTNKECND